MSAELVATSSVSVPGLLEAVLGLVTGTLNFVLGTVVGGVLGILLSI